MSNDSQRLTLVDVICSNILRDITQGILLPGSKINIKELCERYGTSVTPIKLALNRLMSQNIIENFPRQGMKVKSIHADEIDEIFSTRLMLYLYYTKEIITTVNYDSVLKEEFTKIIAQQREAVNNLMPDSSVDEYMQNYRYDYTFHELYLKCSGNKKIVDIYHYINPFLYTMFIFHRRQTKEKDIAGVHEHEAILNAILAKDEPALKEAVTTHIDSARTSIGLILKVNKMF